MNSFDVFDNPPILLPQAVTGTLRQMDLTVQYAATTWRAALYLPSPHLTLVTGQEIKILGRQGNTLLIEI